MSDAALALVICVIVFTLVELMVNPKETIMALSFILMCGALVYFFNPTITVAIAAALR